MFLIFHEFTNPTEGNISILLPVNVFMFSFILNPKNMALRIVEAADVSYRLRY